MLCPVPASPIDVTLVTLGPVAKINESTNSAIVFTSAPSSQTQTLAGDGVQVFTAPRETTTLTVTATSNVLPLCRASLTIEMKQAASWTFSPNQATTTAVTFELKFIPAESLSLSPTILTSQTLAIGATSLTLPAFGPTTVTGPGNIQLQFTGSFNGASLVPWVTTSTVILQLSRPITPCCPCPKANSCTSGSGSSCNGYCSCWTDPSIGCSPCNSGGLCCSGSTTTTTSASSGNGNGIRNVSTITLPQTGGLLQSAGTTTFTAAGVVFPERSITLSTVEGCGVPLFTALGIHGIGAVSVATLYGTPISLSLTSPIVVTLSAPIGGFLTNPAFGLVYFPAFAIDPGSVTLISSLAISPTATTFTLPATTVPLNVTGPGTIVMAVVSLTPIPSNITVSFAQPPIITLVTRATPPPPPCQVINAQTRPIIVDPCSSSSLTSSSSSSSSGTDDDDRHSTERRSRRRRASSSRH